MVEACVSRVMTPFTQTITVEREAGEATGFLGSAAKLHIKKRGNC